MSKSGVRQARVITFEVRMVSDRLRAQGILIPYTAARVEDPVPSPSAERVKFATGTIPKYKDTCRLTSDPYKKDFYMFSADDSEAPEAHFYRCDATNMKWTDLTVRPFIIYRWLCILWPLKCPFSSID